MDGVTDAAMRYMTAKYGNKIPNPKSANSQMENGGSGVDVMFTEFVSVDGLAYAKQPESVARLMSAFIRAQDVGELPHKPYEVAQVFGHSPELFYRAAVMVASLGFDGMDINMGCPAHKVEEHGSGAGLIRTPEVAKEIVRAAKRGIADWAAGRVRVEELLIGEAVKNWIKSYVEQHEIEAERREIPVSVKTRIGVEEETVTWWMEQLLEVEPAMISLHGRTLKQLYQGEADWEAIARAAEVVHQAGGKILGNGDVQSLADAQTKVNKYGVDGVLIGRAAEGNPTVFGEEAEITWEQRKAWMIEHARLYEKVFGGGHFMPMRKHLAWYCKGIPGASEMRERLVRTNSVEEVERSIK